MRKLNILILLLMLYIVREETFSQVIRNINVISSGGGKTESASFKNYSAFGQSLAGIRVNANMANIYGYIGGIKYNYPPTAVCKDITVALDESGIASITADMVDGGSTDDKGIATRAIDKSYFTCSDIGDNPVTLTITDNDGESDVCQAHVTVQDKTPPAITIVLSPANLWPANHRLIDVTARVTATDNCGNVSWQLVSITSSDPESGQNRQDVPDDIQNETTGTADDAFSLRSERSGSGSTRTYIITYKATDNAGNEATATATIAVSNKKPKDINIDETILTYNEKEKMVRNVYPNPANGFITISYYIPSDNPANISIYDNLGNLVVTLLDKDMKKGSYTLSWDCTCSNGMKAESGPYYLLITTGVNSDYYPITIVR